MNAARFSPFLLAALLLGSSAHAQPSEADKRKASTLTLEGQRLLKGGDPYDIYAALAKFQAAHEILRAPTTALDVATAYEALGQLVEARATVFEVSRLPIQPNEPFAYKQARATAASAVEALDSRIPSLVLRIEGAPKEAITATIDNETVPRESLTAPYPRNPGQREIVVTAPGYKTARATVELEEGESKPVEVPIVLARLPQQKEEPTPTRSNALFYTGIAVSGALAMGALGTGIAAAYVEQKGKDDWEAANCAAILTPTCISDFNERARTRALLTHAAVWEAIGAVAVGGGTLAYVLLTKTPADNSPKQAIWVTPTVGGVVVQGTF
jgi:hypothetical protein